MGVVGIVLLLVVAFVLLSSVWSISGLVIALLIWGLIGYLAGRLVRGYGYGPVGNVLLGLTGGVTGSLLLGLIGLGSIRSIPLIGGIVVGVFGAMVVIAGVNLLRGSSGKAKRV